MTIEPSRHIQHCLARLQAGDDDARDTLIELACSRLQRLTGGIKQRYPHVGRWEQTDDLFQNAALRFYDALGKVDVRDARHFYRLAARKIRHELIDMCRHEIGPRVTGAAPKPPDQTTSDPRQLAAWLEFHEQTERLPPREREVFDLLWYNDLPRSHVAELLGITEQQVRRRWRRARLLLDQLLDSNASTDGTNHG